MLRQHGGPMMQSEIADAMPVDLEELAEALRGMEAEGLIHCQWERKANT
jgi:Mn-dependent DtxR family transcriptional regulator